MGDSLKVTSSAPKLKSLTFLLNETKRNLRINVWNNSVDNVAEKQIDIRRLGCYIQSETKLSKASISKLNLKPSKI